MPPVVMNCAVSRTYQMRRNHSNSAALRLRRIHAAFILVQGFRERFSGAAQVLLRYFAQAHAGPDAGQSTARSTPPKRRETHLDACTGLRVLEVAEGLSTS